MSQYTMLNGFKIDVETEPYDGGNFNTDYSKATQLNIHFSANNSHNEDMELKKTPMFQVHNYTTKALMIIQILLS